ncbi:MAG: transcriptional regulator, LacI family [Rhizobacter sp.]|nr:transcriptional regulator, LacI family [Rhizobacter sp.]
MMSPKKPRLSAKPGFAPRSTIGDVAREAGVSKATVSRFLNHRDTLLSREIASRVEVAITALGYSPSPMAQSLKRGRSKLIGLVVADVTNPFSVAVLRGAERACKDAGYLVMLFNLGNESGRETAAIEAMSSYQVEGFILNTLGRDANAVAAAARHGRPVVLVDRRHSDMQADFVSLDNAGATQLCGAHLMASGYRELLFISEPVSDVSPRIERRHSFQAFIDANRQLAGQSYESVAGDNDGLDNALVELRERAGTRAPAIVASNAIVTLRVAASMARLRFRFGHDIGFVGFDDTEWAPLIGPGLTSIAQPTYELGRLAAACLLERLGGLDMPPRQILLPGKLVPRGSTLRASRK